MRDNLRDWEEYLIPFFVHIELLGEIPITVIECEQIAQLIRTLIKQYGPTKATRYLESVYSYTFIVYLAATAAHNTEMDYWGVVSESIGLSKQAIQNQGWGEIFLSTLQEAGLPGFSQAGGYRFVTPIRLHGGIPTYSLPDFFYYILIPSIRNMRYAGPPHPK